VKEGRGVKDSVVAYEFALLLVEHGATRESRSLHRQVYTRLMSTSISTNKLEKRLTLDMRLEKASRTVFALVNVRRHLPEW